jgi:putative ABC transport system substrate-binding protein
MAVTQQSGNIPRVGVLSPGQPPPAGNPAVDLFRQGLRDLGYVEGQTILLDYRYAQGQNERLPALVAELIALQPDVLYTYTTLGVRAAQQATTTIPIVVGVAGDLVAQGIVASLARPGGNITGLTAGLADSKRLELLKEAIPTVTRVAVLFNPANPWNPFSTRRAGDFEAEARALGVQVQRVEVQDPAALDAAFLAIAAGGADALFIPNDTVVSGQQARILEFARQHQLPTIASGREFAAAGGLIGYGPSFPDMYRRASVYVDKILKGAKAADLPVERPQKFELFLNRKTAEVLGITFPPTLLVLADEVIK